MGWAQTKEEFDPHLIPQDLIGPCRSQKESLAQALCGGGACHDDIIEGKLADVIETRALTHTHSKSTGINWE